MTASRLNERPPSRKEWIVALEALGDVSVRSGLLLRWRYEADLYPAATRAAEALARIGVKPGDPLATQSINELAAFCGAIEANPTNDISKHLPVLEPLFRRAVEAAENASGQAM